MISAARWSSRIPGSGWTGSRRGSGEASSDRAITSSGSSRWVAPGFSDSATLNALRTTSGMISGLETRAFHFTTGREDADQVDVLMRFLVHTLEVGLAGERDQRRAVQKSIRDRCDKIGGPGSEGTQADTGSAGQTPVGVGHVRAALFMADRHEPDRGIGQGLVEMQCLLAGNPEDVLDALCLEAFDEHL